METVMLGEGNRIVVVLNQFCHHFDACLAACFWYIFVEPQKGIPPRRCISSSFPGMNDTNQSIFIGVTAAVEPIVISLYLRVNRSKKFPILAVLEYQIGSNCDQGRMCK